MRRTGFYPEHKHEGEQLRDAQQVDNRLSRQPDRAARRTDLPPKSAGLPPGWLTTLIAVLLQPWATG